MGIFKGMQALLLTLMASVLLIVLGIIYFMITIFIIKISAQWAGYGTVAGTTVVLTAGIVTAAAMIGSAIQR